MSRLEVVPFSDEHLEAAAALLARRHARHRALEPLLDPRFEDPAETRPRLEHLWRDDGMSGSAAFRSGRLVGYVIGAPQPPEIWGPNVWIELPGHAVEDAERARDLYGHAAARWVEEGNTRHYALLPAEPELIDAWFRLGFGQQQAHGYREVPREVEVRLPDGCEIRRPEAAMVDELVQVGLALPDHQHASPVFSSRPLPTEAEIRDEWLETLDAGEEELLLGFRDGRPVACWSYVPVERSRHFRGLERPDRRTCSLMFAVTLPESRGTGLGVALTDAGFAWAAAEGYEAMVTDWRVTNLLASRFWPRRGFRASVLPALPLDSVVQRVPLLFGTRLAVVSAPDDAVVLRPPPPGEPVADVRAAVRDALRFPLAGRPLEALVTRGGRATIVVEPPALPLPGALPDPRQDALAAASAELERAGIPTERQTLLVASGLTRRPGQRDLERLGIVSAAFARRFHGAVEVHDAEDPGLAGLQPAGETPLRVSRALLDTDLVLTVSGAETVLDGGPALLLGCGGPEALRAATASSLLEPGASQGWRLAVELERRISARVPVIGASLVLDQPRFGAAARGYPYDAEAGERIARSPFRLGFSLLPGSARHRILRSVRRELHSAGAFAGPPSVAHAEALLRAVEARSATLDGRLDAIVIGIPRTTPHLPRERPNPLLVAYLGLGLALRLWREAFPLAEGGTVILLHRFHRHFSHPTQQPYRAIFNALGGGPRDPEELTAAEREAIADERAIEAYRAGRSCHPLLPFADWAGCAPALGRLGSVIVAGCRDAVAARQLGFVPARGLGPALEMAHGRAGGEARVGYLLSPPYFPIRVSPG